MEDKKQSRKGRKIFEEGKYIFLRRRRERRRIFGEGNMLFAEEKKNREGENLLEKENVTMADTQTDVCLDRNTLLR